LLIRILLAHQLDGDGRRRAGCDAFPLLNVRVELIHGKLEPQSAEGDQQER
jgi:hypothetical protein